MKSLYLYNKIFFKWFDLIWFDLSCGQNLPISNCFMWLLDTFVCVWLGDCTVVTVHILNAMGILNWRNTFIFVRCMLYKVDTLLLLLFGSWIWEINNKTAEFHVINVSKCDFFFVWSFYHFFVVCCYFFSHTILRGTWMEPEWFVIIKLHFILWSKVLFNFGNRECLVCVSALHLQNYLFISWGNETNKQLTSSPNIYTRTIHQLRMDIDWRTRRISRISLFTLSIFRC